MIATSCPAIVYLVEKHYPTLIPYRHRWFHQEIVMGAGIKDRMDSI
ncbi:MAG: [Fe-Fe] hydrogenase large subunit C-terminal domain-containing protein [Eubacterium sp.]